MKFFRSGIQRILALGLICLVSFSNIQCKKVAGLINKALNFEGVFETNDGWEVTLDESSSSGFFSKAGIPHLGILVGYYIFTGMTRTGDDTWTGSVRGNNGFGSFTTGTVQIIGNVVTVKPSGGSLYGLVRSSGSSSGGGSGGSGGSGGGSGSGSGGSSGTITQTLLNEVVTGKRLDKKIYSFTVPAGAKSLTVKLAEDGGQADYNLADMFVRYGSQPTVSVSPRYTWTADCGSVNSNREDEVCNFTNPRSGTWYVMAYGYNSVFASKLIVTITK